MFLTLTKYSFKQYFSKKSIGKKKIRVPQWLTYVLLIVFLSVTFFSLFRELAASLFPIRMGWLYFCLVMLLSMFFMFMSTIVLAENNLFKSKYNDLLLSMPIKSSDILLSRLLEIVLYNYILELMAWIPGLIGLYFEQPFDLGQFLILIVALLFLPLITVVIGTIFGYFLNKVTSKLKNPQVFKVIGTLLFLGAYYVFIYFSDNLFEDILYAVRNFETAFTIVAPIAWFGKAVGDKNLLALLLFILSNVIPFGIMVLVLQKDYISVMTASQAKAVKVYVKREVQQKPRIVALWMREFKRWLNSYTYLINTLIGILFILAATIFVIIKAGVIRSTMIVEMAGFGDLFFPVMAIIFIEGMLCTYMVSSSSISLEGQTVSQLRSLPLTAEEVLNSKLIFHYSLAAPIVLFASLTIVIITQPVFLLGLLVVLVPQLFLFLTGELGLCYNLKYHKLDWANEAECVKRGGATFLSMFGNYILMGLQVAPILIFNYDIEIEMYIFYVFVVMVVLAALIYLLIMKWGCRKYSVLGE